MKHHANRFLRPAVHALVFGLLLGGSTRLVAQEAEDTQQATQVEFFAALRAGQMEVRVVPSSYASLTMRIRNLTKTPLQVELPPTFAAVPTARVQAQQTLRQQGYNASLGGNYGQIGNSQGLGGSLAGPWWGGSLAGPQSAADQGPLLAEQQQERPRGVHLLLAPGRFAQAEIPCFCLEFGRPDPHKRIPYLVCPLEDLNDRPAVAELLARFGQPGINQYVTQLAAWHVASGTPWQMLAQVQFPRTGQGRGHKVTPAELMAARQLAQSLPSYGQQGSLSGAH